MNAVRRTSCRLCGSQHVEKVIDLDPIPLSENYSSDPASAAAAPRYPIDVYMCGSCGHVQQLDVVDPHTLWNSYTYYSGDAKGMPEHFADVAARIIQSAELPADALVIDIGSNDGSLLQPFKAAGYRVLGIDPARDAAQRAIEAGIPTITELMSIDLARRIRDQHGPAHVVCAFNVFAHADNLGEMVEGIRTMMAPDGLFFFEAQYLLDIVDGTLVATIFHEHLSHHSVKPLIPFFHGHGLELIAVERSPIQHGSLIGIVQLRGGSQPVQHSVAHMVQVEEKRKLDKLDTLRAFNATIRDLRQRTRVVAERWKEQGATVAGYGAARSGPTLIIQFGLSGKLDFIVDDHPQKVGKFETGDGLPILRTSELLARMPNYTVILAWVHSRRIVENNLEYLRRGGQFVVLCPEPRVIGASGQTRI